MKLKEERRRRGKGGKQRRRCCWDLRSRRATHILATLGGPAGDLQEIRLTTGLTKDYWPGR
jgi:hypothetical protein